MTKKINRITVTVPKTEKDKWLLSFGIGAKRRRSALSCFNLISRRFHAQSAKEKVSMRVVYGKDTTNTSMPSNDTTEQLWAMGCFLEDYLPKATLTRIQKEYLNR